MPTNDGLGSESPFYFKVDLPEGRYKVTLALGSPNQKSAITVKAESRRLMLENIEIEPGEIVTRTILVDVRTPRINATESIRLKQREHQRPPISLRDRGSIHALRRRNIM